jgi:hypothetical protein
MSGSRFTRLLDGGRYFEAPRWHDHRLWLVDSRARTLISMTPEGTPEIARTLQGIPAGPGFLQNGEAVVTDMHGRSLFRCAGGRHTSVVLPAYWAVKIAKLCSVSAWTPIEAARPGRNLNPMWMPQLSKCPAQATHKLQEVFFAVRRS